MYRNEHPILNWQVISRRSVLKNKKHNNKSFRIVLNSSKSIWWYNKLMQILDNNLLLRKKREPIHNVALVRIIKNPAQDKAMELHYLNNKMTLSIMEVKTT